MNTSLGYAKRTLTDTSVLLSGGGDKPLSNFIGSISWDSTNKKITYTPVGGNATDLVSFGSNAFNSTAYLTSVHAGDLGVTPASYKTTYVSAGIAPYISDIGTNIFAGATTSEITVERSTNNGSSWTDVTAAEAANVKNVFSGAVTGTLVVSGNSKGAVGDRLRITFNPSGGSRYCQLAFIYIYFSTNGCGCVCDVEKNLYTNKTLWSAYTSGAPISGWSGPNVIGMGGTIFGLGDSRNDGYGLRLTFRITSVDSTYDSRGYIYSILGFTANRAWGVPSGNSIARSNTPYSYLNADRAVLFDNTITSSGFIKTNSDDTYVLTGGGGHALISELSVSSAATLTTPRSLWGNSFNGEADISGAISFGGGRSGFSVSNESNALIKFGSNGKTSSSEMTYWPLISDRNYDKTYGYGNSLVIGSYHANYGNCGLYFGFSWDGANSNLFYYFGRNGNATFPGTITATSFTGSLSGNATSATKATNDSDGNAINSTYLKKSGGTMTGDLTTTGVTASGTSNRLIFRHLDGQNCNGDYNLYLQYHQSNAVTYFNGGTYYIKGGYYNGKAESAGYADSAGSVTWSNVSSKPETATRWPTWDEVTNKPSSFNPSSHDHYRIKLSDDRAKYPGQLTGNEAMSTFGGFMQNSTLGISNFGSYSDVLVIRSYADSSGGNDNAIIFNKNTRGVWHTQFGFGSTTSWGTPYLFLDSNNFNDYSPTLTGTGASGTWGINITGSAGSVSWDNVSDKPDTFTPSTHDHDDRYVKFYLSPMASNAPADSAKSWFVNTMPSASGAIIYNVPGSEKTIIVGKSSGAYGHMLQLSYDDTYLRVLRYKGGTWQSTDWEKISAGYADSAGSAGSATNIAGGAQGSIPYLTAAGTTAFLAGGTNGYVLAYSTTSKAPYWKADNNTQYYLTLNGTTKGNANTNDLGTIYAPTSSGTGFLKCSVSGTTVTWSYDNSTYLTSHYTATPVLGGSSATSNATSNTSDPYLNIVENSTKSGGILLKGGGSTSVTAKNGVATISSTNTLYYLTLNGGVKGTASTNDLGTIYAPTTAGTGFLKGTAGANGAITWSWDNSTYNNYSLPTATASALGGVKVGTTLTSDTGYTKVHIKDGFIYYKDTNTWQAANTSQVGYVPSTSANTMLYANSSGSATWGTPDLYEVNVGGNVDTAETLTEKITYGGVLGFYFGGGMLGWLDEDGININHASSALGATTIGSSTASSGSTVDIPYILTDEYGHVTAGGTHTHTISVSGYLPTGGGELTGSLTLPKTTLAIKFNTRTGAGIKYDYGGNEALMISARAYSAASILLYAGESSKTRSLDDNSGQWSAGSSASNYMGVPNMQIKNGSVLINTAVQTGTLSGEYANALYVTGNAYLKGSSGSDNGMLTHNGTRYALFGTGASGATGIWVQGIGNDGWIVGVNPSGTPFFNGNANSATSATSATSASYASYLTFDSSKTCASANHSFTYYNTNTSTTSSSTNGVANPEASKWFHHISMVRGDSSGYFFDLAFSLSEWSTPRIYFRNRAASNYSTWKEIVTSANYTEYLTGGGGSIDLNHKTFSSLGSSTYYRLAYVYLSGTSNTTLSKLYYTSGLYVNNSGVYHTSDIAYKEAIRKYLLKKNVLDLENPVKKFKWKGTNDEAVGFIAQETEEWCPEAVGQDEDGYKTVNYTVALSGLCSALYDEVKTLRKEIEELKDKK